ncbi:MAG: hypothetical protein HY074_17870, partial [Deltaproteobacteria bacterium]|nr:hypothetical protein [Deltaproteobacteria bacterium]
MNDIKSLIETGKFSDALRAMRETIAGNASPNALFNLAKWLERIPSESYKENGYLTKKILVLGGYTTQLIAPLLKVVLLRHKIRAEVLEGDYGTFEQAVYAADQRLTGFKPDLCYFCVGTEHLGFEDRAVELQRWRRLWQAAREAFACDIIQNTFEEPLHRICGGFDLKWHTSRTRYVRQLNLELAADAPGFVHFNDVDGQAAHFGRRNWRDEKLFDSSKVPVAFALLPAYARQVADISAAVFGRSRKCLVLDLDNTLWGGVIGDDGPAKIQIGLGSAAGEAHARLQAYARGLKERGIILAVCSKNDEKTAKEPFL